MKRKLKIGTAVVQPKFCLAWKEMRLCLVCDEQCPYNAIKVERKGKYPKPKVIEEKCVGCGLCEYKCPASGRPGIRIFPIF
jgi:MinD superfamily P-loop ATPase